MRGRQEKPQPGRRLFALLAIAWLTSTPILAEGQAPEGSTAVGAVLACRAIKDRARQLTCFRIASDRLAAEQTPEGAPPPSPPAIPARAFGARPARPARAVRPPEARRATLTLRAINDPGDGRVVFNFDDGSTWREIEPASVAGALKVGERVILEKGLLGSYFLDIPGRASVKVSRLSGG